MRALVRIATPVGCAAIAACSFPVDGYTVVDASALQGGHPPVDAAMETTADVDSGATSFDAPADTSPAIDSAPDVLEGDTCHCVDWAGGSGHCKTWDPPGCGT